VLAVKNEYRTNLELYLAAMLQAKKMLTQGILTSADLVRVNAIIAEKYGIPENSLYRG
jgi:hypothetical protein